MNMKMHCNQTQVVAYLSLALSLTLTLLWCCNVGGFTAVTLDTFVGVIVMLLTIIVTLAIGWQIYNSLEINRKIEKLNNDIAEVTCLKSQLQASESRITQVRNEAMHYTHMAIADMLFGKGDKVGAFRFYHSALLCSLKLESPRNVDQMLSGMSNSMIASPGAINLQGYFYDDVERVNAEIRNSK